MSRHRGLNAHRLAPNQENPEEVRFAEAWAKENAQGNVLAHILRDHSSGFYDDPSDRDCAVAASVVQWLGTNVGRAFLHDLGYERVKPVSDFGKFILTQEKQRK